MDITHLHLNVRDLSQSSAFYQRWFGLEVKRQQGDVWFLCGDQGFLLVLLQDADPAPAPAWAHFGVARANAHEVLTLHQTMLAAGVPIVRAYEQSQTLTSFRAADPNGHVVEVYWLHQPLTA